MIGSLLFTTRVYLWHSSAMPDLQKFYPDGRRRVRRHPPHVKVQAKELYMFTTATYKTISEKLGVPKPTLRFWSKEDKWPDERRKLERDLQERSSFEVAKTIRDNVGKVLSRQLAVGEKLENHIQKIVDKALDDDTMLTPEDVMLLAKAFNSSGRITSQAVGIQHRNMRSKDGVTPVNVLINTNFTPKELTADPVFTESAVTIDVTPEPDTDFDPECGF